MNPGLYALSLSGRKTLCPELVYWSRCRSDGRESGHLGSARRWRSPDASRFRGIRRSAAGRDRADLLARGYQVRFKPASANPSSSGIALLTGSGQGVNEGEASDGLARSLAHGRPLSIDSAQFGDVDERRVVNRAFARLAAVRGVSGSDRWCRGWPLLCGDMISLLGHVTTDHAQSHQPIAAKPRHAESAVGICRRLRHEASHSHLETAATTFGAIWRELGLPSAAWR